MADSPASRDGPSNGASGFFSTIGSLVSSCHDWVQRHPVPFIIAAGMGTWWLLDRQSGTGSCSSHDPRSQQDTSWLDRRRIERRSTCSSLQDTQTYRSNAVNDGEKTMRTMASLSSNEREKVREDMASDLWQDLRSSVDNKSDLYHTKIAKHCYTLGIGDAERGAKRYLQLAAGGRAAEETMYKLSAAESRGEDLEPFMREALDSEAGKATIIGLDERLAQLTSGADGGRRGRIVWELEDDQAD